MYFKSKHVPKRKINISFIFFLNHFYLLNIITNADSAGVTDNLRIWILFHQV